jgi:hypothetical protein
LLSSVRSLVDSGVPAERAGLLLDLLATGQRMAVNDAFELFLTLFRPLAESEPVAGAG